MHKKLGILGGMRPMATVDFMKRVVEKSPAASDQEHIPMIISNNPLTPDRTTCILDNGDDPIDVMMHDLQDLKSSGATKVVVPCNTAHYWIDKLSDVHLSFISIIDSVIDEVCRRKMQNIGILATDATLKAKIYERSIESEGKHAILPTPEQQQDVMAGIKAVKAGDIERGRALMEPVFDSLLEQGADGVILGCTEIPLAFDAFSDEKKAKSLDSLDLLADECVKYYYQA